MSLKSSLKGEPLTCLTSGKRNWVWRNLKDFKDIKSDNVDIDSAGNNNVTGEKRKDVSLSPAHPEQLNKKSKKAKNKIFINDETGDLDHRKPETNQDFERLLLGSPNSSILWVQYMSHQIGMGEIQKSREVGARALKIISQLEEKERMNVHKALINLEVRFGNDEDVKNVFSQALQMCDEKPLYFALADDYEAHNKFEAAQETFRNMLKKFPQDVEACTKFGLFLYKQGKIEVARELLKTCLKRFDKRDQIQIATQFATMEFKHGDPERGRTIFERLVKDNRKRSDIWSVWIDMERKADQLDNVRSLFERVTSITSYSSKVMQFLFNKWLKFEEECGSSDQIEKVKERAKAYVKSRNK